MMALPANALITVDEYRIYRGYKQGSDAVNADQLEALIGAASAFAENECGRKFVLPSAAIDEIFNGDDSKDYYTQHAPIKASDPTPVIAQWNGTAWVTSLNTIAINSERGRVYFTDGGEFECGCDNYRITYKYGWTVNDVPRDLKHAVCQMVHRMQLTIEGKEGVSSESFGDMTQTIDIDKLPRNVKAVFERYTRRLI